jgi:hypothetical protein
MTLPSVEGKRWKNNRIEFNINQFTIDLYNEILQNIFDLQILKDGLLLMLKLIRLMYIVCTLIEIKREITCKNKLFLLKIEIAL